MHRFINSRDVEEYSTDAQPRDIQLTKDEDIEYRSGTLYSSSGTTFVEILTFSQGTQQQLADEEEPSNLTDSNMFTVNGSYIHSGQDAMLHSLQECSSSKKWEKCG